MKLFRRATHVVSMIAPLVLLASMAGSQTPANQTGIRQKIQPNRATNRTDTQPKPDPRGTSEQPLVIEVQPAAQSDKEAAEKHNRENQEASDRKFNRSIALLTIGVLIGQLVLFGYQVYIVSRQSKIFQGQSAIMSGQLTQATAAATTASEQLRLAFHPHVDITPFTLMRSGLNMSEDTVDYILAVRVTNRTDVLARIETIEAEYWVGTQRGTGTVVRMGGFTLGREQTNDVPIQVDLSRFQIERLTSPTTALSIRVALMVQLRHPITGPFWHTWDQWIRFREGEDPSILTAEDYDGRLRPSPPSPQQSNS